MTNSILFFLAPANFSLLEETETLAIASGNTTGLSLQIGKMDRLQVYLLSFLLCLNFRHELDSPFDDRCLFSTAKCS